MSLDTYGSGQVTGVAAYPRGGAVAQDTAPRETTALEAHLSFLKHLQDQAGNAVSRAMRTADRLFGSEPAQLAKNTLEPKAPSEPPLVMQIEEASRSVGQMLETLHQQLSRLERV